MDIEYEIEKNFQEYDQLLREQIRLYLKFTLFWIRELIQLNNFSRALEILNNEWTFCKNNFFYVTSSDLYVKHFCKMLSHINSSLLNLTQSLGNKYKVPLIEFIENKLLRDSSNLDFSFEFNRKCYEIKDELDRLNEIYMDTFKFCNRLIYDMEIVAKYRVVQPETDLANQSSGVQNLLDRLKENNYFLIRFKSSDESSYVQNLNANFMIFIAEEFIAEKIQIVRLLFINNEIDSLPVEDESNTNGCLFLKPNSGTKGYLIYLEIPSNVQESFEWRGKQLDLYASMPVRTTLYEKNVHKKGTKFNLYLLTASQSILNQKRLEFERKMSANVTIIREKTSFHPNICIEAVIDDLKNSILNLRKETTEFIRDLHSDLKKITENTDEYDLIQNLEFFSKLKLYLNKILKAAYNFGIKLHSECIKFMTFDRAKEFSFGLVEFTEMWFNYLRNNDEKCKKI
jgi:hypothetical protein